MNPKRKQPFERLLRRARQLCKREGLFLLVEGTSWRFYCVATGDYLIAHDPFERRARAAWGAFVHSPTVWSTIDMARMLKARPATEGGAA